MIRPFPKYDRVQKVQNLMQFSASVTSVLPLFWIAAVHLKSNTNLLCTSDCLMFYPNLVQFSPLVSENKVGESCSFFVDMAKNWEVRKWDSKIWNQKQVMGSIPVKHHLPYSVVVAVRMMWTYAFDVIGIDRVSVITVCTIVHNCYKGRSKKYRKWHFSGCCRRETP